MGIYSESLAEKIKRKIEEQIEEQKAQFKVAPAMKRKQQQELKEIRYKAYITEKKRQEKLKGIEEARKKPLFARLSTYWKKGRKKSKGKKGRTRYVKEPKKKKKPPISLGMGSSITGEHINVFG